jgi:hypothetical protein
MSDRISAALRRFVQQRARGRCEYCLLHGDHAMLPHEPDHIIALKHGGRTHEANLAWACFLCNRFKGSDLASIDIETGQVVRLFNPRADDWSMHFRLQDGRIDPLTPIGRVTEYLLQFNRPENVALRSALRKAGDYPGVE